MLRGFFKRKRKEETEEIDGLSVEETAESAEGTSEEASAEAESQVLPSELTESVASDAEEGLAEIAVEEVASEASVSEKEQQPTEICFEEKREETVSAEEASEKKDAAEEENKDENEKGNDEANEEIKEENRGGFFKRLKEGLSKTRNAIADKLDNVLSAFQSVDEELFEELEEALIMADVGVDTSLYIIGELRKRVKEQNVKEPQELKALLKEIISELLMSQNSTLDTSKKPTVIMVIGVNGVGKTTSIGKLAARYRKEGKKVILAAADTFRAAAIDQLQIWAERAGAEIVKHQEGSDPSAVVFDAIAAAKSRDADIVICDTAGRLHNKKNLMEELKKTARVIERETGSNDYEVLLVLDGSTGQNALIQAKEFASVANITGVILTKLDGTAKGGVVIALSREQNIGVKFIGVGEDVDDLQEFRPEEFAAALFGE